LGARALFRTNFARLFFGGILARLMARSGLFTLYAARVKQGFTENQTKFLMGRQN